PNFFNNYFNKNFGDKQEQVIAPVLADSLSKTIDTIAVDTLAQNNDLIKLSTDSITKPKIDSSAVTTYEVLVSAIATEKKANRIIANLAKEGVQAKKIKLSKTMINISAGTFLTEYEAKLYRDSLRVVLKNQGIYIQPIKPKK
ncbi:MAG: SPOR domain-containing protein, partial [Flavobacterium sp.]